MKKYLLLLPLSFTPHVSHACAVCFGGANGDMIRGFTWGIALLLVLPFLLMGGFAGWIVYSVKKNKNHE